MGSKMQQAKAQAQAVVVAQSAVAPAAGHTYDPAGGDAPPKQVAQAMERLGRAGRLIADIRLSGDRLLEALFVAGGAPPYNAHQHADRTARAVTQEEAAMRRHFQDLRALGRQLEESGVLNGALKAQGNSWGLHMPLVCPDGAVVAYAWKRQLAGQAGASAVDRTRLALKAFTDQKRRFFPHLEDEVLSHLHDGEPGVAKRTRLSASNEELEEKTLSEILKNLGNEVPNLKIFTYRHLDWSKRASSLASLMDDDFVDPSKELNLQNMGKLRSGALTTSIDQVAVIELLVPSIFRAVVSLHPAGSTDPDAVAFFSPTEGGSYLHARGLSVHHVFKHVKEHADKALQYFISVKPSKALSLLLRWIASYQSLFTKVCSKCRRLLLMDKSLALLLPPVHHPYHQTSNVGSDLQEAYHIGCSSYDG
ncbi:mediator of RNA polymerase II transcription subunit 27-like [Phragmites australis]|uniref:mediator of RNA polymerase II transcription subunit 27-like n=1 Tax=Phragmites australis TaxID=29695 RepID=UPI002D781CEE|nr:mediator of RNA polymerase II transcription subunit 27-like [Phragmites australis]